MTETDTVGRFVEQAKKFCQLIERRKFVSASDFPTQCAQCLNDLYRAAPMLSALPVEADTEALIEDAVLDDQARKIRDEIGKKFGDHRFYWTVFNPYEVSSPIACDLGDDLADIYRDIKDGLVAFNKGDAAEGLWHWQHSFRTHWGSHLVNALRAIHYILSARMFEEAYLDTSHA